jgi:DNA-binding LytR/AlgR family response regulator
MITFAASWNMEGKVVFSILIQAFNMIRAVAIDDEPKAISVLQAHAKRLDGLVLERVFTDPFQGVSYLEKERADLLFLDVQMPGLAGFDLLKLLARPPAVIFTSAHRDYALDSYEVDAVDYLLKPFDFERFSTAVEKARLRLEQAQQEDLFLKSGKRTYRMPLHELLYVAGEGNYVRYVGTRNSVLVRSSIHQAKAELEGKGLVQVHRSYLLAVKRLDRIDGQVAYVNGQQIPISASYKQGLLDHLQRTS